MGTNFILTQQAYRFTGSQLVFNAAASADGSSMTVRGYNPDTSSINNAQIEVKIPTLNIDAANTNGVILKYGGHTYLDSLQTISFTVGDFMQAFGQYSYMLLGEWIDSGGGGTNTYFTPFVAGYQTQNVPTTGTATYSNGGYAQGVILNPANSASLLTVTGGGGVVVDFGAKTVAGTVNLNVTNNASNIGTFSVGLTGPLAGATFSGATTLSSMTPSGGNAASFSGPASGAFKGALYGPNADNLGLTWSLTDGTNTAIGVFGAKKD